MSQVDPNFDALVAQKFNEMLIANFCAVSATTLLFYDYIITFSDEVRCIWQGKFSGATVLFLLNRYVTIIYRTLMIVQLMPWQTQTEEEADRICVSILRFTEGLTILWEMSVALFMALRMYAIWSSSRKIFGFVLLLGLVAPAINMYYYTIIQIIATPEPFTGCGELVNLSTKGASTLSRFNRVFAILVDAIILVLTWVRTAGIMRSISALKIKASLNVMLLRDGTVYFIFLLSLNIINLIAVEGQKYGAIPAISDVVTSILVSRFILNLRGVYLLGQESPNGSFHASNFSDIRFARTVTGNLGAPLDIGCEHLNPSSSSHMQVQGENDCDDKHEEEIFSLDPIMVGLPNRPTSASAPRLPMTATEATWMTMTNSSGTLGKYDGDDEDEDRYSELDIQDQMTKSDDIV